MVLQFHGWIYIYGKLKQYVEEVIGFFFFLQYYLQQLGNRRNLYVYQLVNGLKKLIYLYNGLLFIYINFVICENMDGIMYYYVNNIKRQVLYDYFDK